MGDITHHRQSSSLEPVVVAAGDGGGWIARGDSFSLICGPSELGFCVLDGFLPPWLLLIVSPALAVSGCRGITGAASAIWEGITDATSAVCAGFTSLSLASLLATESLLAALPAYTESASFWNDICVGCSWLPVLGDDSVRGELQALSQVSNLASSHPFELRMVLSAHLQYPESPRCILYWQLLRVSSLPYGSHPPVPLE